MSLNLHKKYKKSNPKKGNNMFESVLCHIQNKRLDIAKTNFKFGLMGYLFRLHGNSQEYRDQIQKIDSNPKYRFKIEFEFRQNDESGMRLHDKIFRIKESLDRHQCVVVNT